MAQVFQPLLQPNAHVQPHKLSHRTPGRVGIPSFHVQRWLRELHKGEGLALGAREGLGSKARVVRFGTENTGQPDKFELQVKNGHFESLSHAVTGRLAFYLATLIWGKWTPGQVRARSRKKEWRGRAAQEEEAHTAGRTLYSGGIRGAPGGVPSRTQAASRRRACPQTEPLRCSARSRRSRLCSSSSQCCASSCACGRTPRAVCAGRGRRPPIPPPAPARASPSRSPTRDAAPPASPPAPGTHPWLAMRGPRRGYPQLGRLPAALGRLLLDLALQLEHALVLGGRRRRRGPSFPLLPPGRWTRRA